MRKGLNEIAYDKTLKLSSKISEKIDQTLKGDKPFNMVKIDPDVQIWAVNNLGYEDLADLMKEYPPEASPP